ncbi:MAG: hypothetical protein HY744_26210 [Deltaproteobacteria bacterium]|nr:hypothetical protein [Deltaproteobacteria bacterium]
MSAPPRSRRHDRSSAAGPVGKDDICQSGSCVPHCVGGTVNCGGKCVDLQSDVANCGSCGKACAKNEQCVSGACKLVVRKTCLEIIEKGESVGDGVYQIDSSGGDPSDAFKTYCDMSTDGGGWTLIEMASSSLKLDNTYWSSAERSPQLLESFGNSPNATARLAATKINEICRAGKGYVRSRYANNQPGHMLTDWFAPNILQNLDIAYALRGDSSYQAGFRGFGNGNLTVSPGGDWRRYNALLSDNLLCSSIQGYCGGGGTPQAGHGPLCDTYGCNKPGQRDIQGHMWWTYGPQGWVGAPGPSYGQYDHYGSRWCK